MSDAVLFDARPDGIAVITVNRPERRNCLDSAVRAGLFEAWDRFEHDPALRVAILTGAGTKAFCAGGDLAEMVATGMGVPPREMFPVPYDTVELSKPTIAAVNGAAFAGGWMIAQACDLCVASTTATFAVTEVRVGRSSPWAAPLIHMIPQRIMMELLLTGKPIDARRAYEIGLVNRLAEPGELLDTAVELATEILGGGPPGGGGAPPTPEANIGMGGPAMIEGGGLGLYAPEDIGPVEVQRRNGVVHVVAADE
ncbi:enoyl-CoA hydratase/isomerase family protein, partial [Nocardia wallacei]|uniref:enoyl-CoA hydratase/isomerase family protein n=1 Tax=Nocardia wallacei TaxID=480035 RepID=UPI002454163E